MSWLQRNIDRAVNGLIESAENSPSYNENRSRQKSAAPVRAAARELAFRDVDDQEARDRLRQRLPADPQPASDAIAAFAKLRDNFIDDRAYRLLTAAVNDAAVGPIDPAVRDAFREQEALGRMPLEDAFALLAAREPGLLEVKDHVSGTRWRTSHKDPEHHLESYLKKQIHKLVGVGARPSDPLLHSDLAASVVRQYLLIVGRARSVRSVPGASDVKTAFFASPLKMEVFTTALPPTRPMAAN